MRMKRKTRVLARVVYLIFKAEQIRFEGRYAGRSKEMEDTMSSLVDMVDFIASLSIIDKSSEEALVHLTVASFMTNAGNEFSSALDKASTIQRNSRREAGFSNTEFMDIIIDLGQHFAHTYKSQDRLANWVNRMYIWHNTFGGRDAERYNRWRNLKIHGTMKVLTEANIKTLQSVKLTPTEIERAKKAVAARRKEYEEITNAFGSYVSESLAITGMELVNIEPSKNGSQWRRVNYRWPKTREEYYVDVNTITKSVSFDFCVDSGNHTLVNAILVSLTRKRGGEYARDVAL